MKNKKIKSTYRDLI